MRFPAFAVLAVLVSAPPAAGQRPAPLPTVGLPDELARVLTDYERAWSDRDAAGLADLFAPDGFVMGGGMPPARGREAIRAFYEGKGGPLFLRALAFAAEDSVGWIIGGYRHAQDSPDTGKFSLTLRKGADGRWLIVTDMDNGNR
jgi:ketosteroid isomerase-like protein